jgi:hypothetical protein
MNATEDDDIGIGFGSLLAQPQGITHEISDILDLLDLVVMRQNDSIPLHLQAQNLGGKIGWVRRRGHTEERSD